MTTEQTYNYKVVRQFAIMTVVWGIVGMLVGVLIAAQLAWPALNFDIAWLSFGRLRPLHTNAVIFAFGGSALFATSYYVVQRTCHARLFAGPLAAFTFWGWQLIIVLAAVTLPLGYTASKEYAELEWPIDILITLVWVAYAVVFFGTLVKRKIRHIYVANWFFGGFIVTVAVLHIVNSAALPVSLTKSYSAYAGVQDLDRGLFGHHVLLHAETSRSAGILLPSFRGALLGSGVYLYLGWAAPFAFHRIARLDTVSGHGVLGHSAGTELGRYGQWHHDAVGRMGKTAHRPDSEVSGGVDLFLRYVDLRRADDGD